MMTIPDCQAQPLIHQVFIQDTHSLRLCLKNRD